MNILEHYLEKIISVEPYESDWTKEQDKEFVRVVVTANCYGDVREYTHIYTPEQWETVKEQGYFWA